MNQRHAGLMGVVAIVWIWSLLFTDERALGDFGVVAILPITAYLCLLAVLGGFLHALQFDIKGRLLGSYVVGLTVMLSGIAPMVYEHLRFSWAWKHVGIVEYIQRTGGVDPHINALPVYHNWPAFFGVSAGMNEVSGLDSALAYASWAPVVFNLMFVAVLYVLFRGLSSDHRLIWTSILFFEFGNWVGQDYFAPQAVAYVLYLLVITILLRWYARTPLGPGGVDVRPEDAIPPGSPASLVLGGVLMVMLLALSATHQLTPIMAILAIGALTVFKVVRVKWPLIAMVVFTAAWLFGPARDFVLTSVGGVFRELGGFQNNLDNTLVDNELFNSAQLVVSRVARLLSAAIVFLAGLGLLRRTHHRLSVRWSIILAVVPAVLVAVSSYGGEVLFRAYLFALPILVFLAASLWFPIPGARHRAWGRISLGAVAILLIGGLLVAEYGTDNRQVFSDDEVAAATFVYENAAPGALIVEGSRDYPRQFTNYELFEYIALDRSRPQTLRRLEADPAGTLASWLADDAQFNGGYIILTDSQRRSVTSLGPDLTPTLDSVERALLESDAFEVVFRSGGAVVFGLRDAP